MPLDGLEVSGTAASEDTEGIDAGVIDEVSEDAVSEEEVDKEVASIGLEALVIEDKLGLEENGKTEASAELVVELGSNAEELEDVGMELEVPAKEVVVEVGRRIGVELGSITKELEVDVVEVGRRIGVELGSTTKELEVSVDEMTEEVAVVEVGRTIGVVTMDDVVEVGKMMGRDDVVAVVDEVIGNTTLVLPLPVHCDD